MATTSNKKTRRDATLKMMKSELKSDVTRDCEVGTREKKVWWCWGVLGEKGDDHIIGENIQLW